MFWPRKHNNVRFMETTRTSSTQEWGAQHYEPAGLEVALPESTLEYHNPPFQEKFLHDNGGPQVYLASAQPEDGRAGPTGEFSSNTQSRGCLPRTRRQRLWCLAAAALLVAIVAGAAVGGTLASRNGSKSGGTTDSSPSTTTPSPTPSSGPTTTPPKSIKQNSPLAVTAWRKVNGVEIYLFFHGPDNVLYRSTYDSASAPSTVNSSSLWQPPLAATTKAAATSPLCATTIVWDEHFEPQVELYHFSPPDNLLTGTNFNNQLEPKIQEDGILSYNLTSHPSSRIACFWPYIVYQDINNQYVEMRNDLDGYGKGTFSPSAAYTAHGLKLFGIQGSRVGVVPLSTFMGTTASKGGYGVVAQGTDGNLFAFIPDEQQTTNVTRSWSAGADFPSINLPQGASFTAFATARPNDSRNRTNTYVLYQAVDGKIGMVWRDDESSWKTSQPDILADADMGTDIACLTMPESVRTLTGSILLLEPVSTETRCYFQRGGFVREVRLNGTDWVDLGIVPLP